MAIGEVRVKYRGGDNLGVLSRSELNKILKFGMKSVAFYWHNHIRMDHFTNEGARKYHYTARKTKDIFNGRAFPKKKKPTTTLPLVESGKSRQISQQMSLSDLSRFKAKANYNTRAFNYKPPKAKPGLDMNKEFSTVLRKEEVVLARHKRDIIRRRLRQFSRYYTVLIK